MSSKSRIIAGAAIILLGVGILVYRGVNITREETVLKVGTLDVRASTQERVPIPAPLGWAFLAGGTFLIFTAAVSRKA